MKSGDYPSESIYVLVVKLVLVGKCVHLEVEYIQAATEKHLYFKFAGSASKSALGTLKWWDWMWILIRVTDIMNCNDLWRLPYYTRRGDQPPIKLGRRNFTRSHSTFQSLVFCLGNSILMSLRSILRRSLNTIIRPLADFVVIQPRELGSIRYETRGNVVLKNILLPSRLAEVTDVRPIINHTIRVWSTMWGTTKASIYQISKTTHAFWKKR